MRPLGTLETGQRGVIFEMDAGSAGAIESISRAAIKWAQMKMTTNFRGCSAE